MVIDNLITNLGNQVHVIIVWLYVSNNIGLGDQLMRPVYSGCLHSNYTKYYTGTYFQTFF